ncbi:hypothetical protein [Methylocella silvestris]|uniref:Uncharacterized protein n=1 Tax=Methylocella silvestris TaxID=199596 RepID=A0A2J7TD77_METSI|nr:hypothetical protein [Methylocella silvestris]PNG24726.1 hypothetical protein CR492_17140 [Methylocella silvestris]
MQGNITAALRRFPSHRRAIEQRAAFDDSFSSLCEDLAEAEDALKTWEVSQWPKREERCAELRELVDGLAAELASALSAD